MLYRSVTNNFFEFLNEIDSEVLDSNGRNKQNLLSYSNSFLPFKKTLLERNFDEQEMFNLLAMQSSGHHIAINQASVKECLEIVFKNMHKIQNLKSAAFLIRLGFKEEIDFTESEKRILAEKFIQICKAGSDQQIRQGLSLNTFLRFICLNQFLAPYLDSVKEIFQKDLLEKIFIDELIECMISLIHIQNPIIHDIIMDFVENMRSIENLSSSFQLAIVLHYYFYWECHMKKKEKKSFLSKETIEKIHRICREIQLAYLDQNQNGIVKTMIVSIKTKKTLLLLLQRTQEELDSTIVIKEFYDLLSNTEEIGELKGIDSVIYWRTFEVFPELFETLEQNQRDQKQERAADGIEDWLA